jgi:hypothetical protein
MVGTSYKSFGPKDNNSTKVRQQGLENTSIIDWEFSYIQRFRLELENS